MPGFGRFVTVAELASSGPYTLWSARPAGEEGEAAFAIRSFRIEDDFADPEALEEQARRFVASAELQRKLAEAGGAEARWAKVYEAGKTASHAYYVTDLFPVSGQRLIDTRRSLSGEQVVAIARSVVAGLLALEGAERRAHGDLRPSNVMIPSLEGRGPRALLADPAPAESLSESAMEEDRRALAGLVVQLVTYRTIAKAGEVRDGPEWQRLGKRGQAIRAWCERAGTPGDAGKATLAELDAGLAECLKASEGGGGGGSKVAIAAVAAIVVLGGGGLLAWQVLKPATVVLPPEPEVVVEPPVATAEWLAAEVAEGEEAARRVLSPEADFESTTVETNARAAANVWSGVVRTRAALVAEASATMVEGVKPDAAARRQANERARAFAAEGGPFRAALASVGDYRKRIVEQKATDPPRVDRVVRLIERIDERVKAARDAVGTEGSPEAKAALAKLEAEAAGLRARADELRGQIEGAVWDQAPAGAAPDYRDAMIKEMRARLTTLRSDDTFAPIERLAEEVDQQTTAAVAALIERWRGETVSRSEPLQRAYSAVIDGLGGGGAGGKVTYGSATRAHEAVVAWVNRVEETLARPTMEGAGAGMDAARGVLETRRTEATTRLAAKVEASRQAPADGASAEIDAEAVALGTFVESASAVVAAAASIDALIADAYGFGEAPAGGGLTLEALVAKIRGERAFADVAELGSGAIARAERVRDAGAGAAAPALIERIRAAGATGAEIVLSWRELHKVYPATAAEIPEAARLIAEYVRPAVQKMPTEARRNALAKVLDAAPGESVTRLKAAWVARVSGDTVWTGPDIEAEFAQMEVLGVTKEDEAALPDFVRFNLAKWRAVSEARALAAQAGDQNAAAMAMAGRFVGADAGSLKTLAGSRGLGAIEKRLQDVSIGRAFDPGAVGPARATPAWTVADKGANDEFIVYKGPGDVLVRFIRVSGADDSMARYVSASEVSVGLLEAVVGRQPSPRWTALWALTREFDPFNNAPNANNRDGRRGPRTWASPRGRFGPPRATPDTAQGWLTGNGRGTDVWFEGVASAPTAGPSDASPMNYISSRGALYVAALMGCRLPTQAEWEAAGRAAGAGQQNQADEAFKQMHDRVLRMAGVANPTLPWPHGDALGIGVAQDRLTAPPQIVAGNDGVIFFRDVRTDAATFTDLGGNVSEWVLIAEPPQTISPDAEGVRGVIGAGSAAAIAGPAAISDPARGVVPGTSFTQTYSDVGFRLAFSGEGGGSGSLARQLAEAVAQVPYLSKGGN